MTTVQTAAQRRQILANAHAKWMAQDSVIPSLILEKTLMEVGTISEDDFVVEVGTDGATTIQILLDTGERLELDAYGNVLRGQ